VAEKLPFAHATFDGVICKGVIPFTSPEKAFREISRVLKSGGIAQFCYLSSGFYLRYLLVGPEMWLRHRFYGLRTLLNTWLFAVTGRRLPGRLGDTTYQWQNQLERLYAKNGFALVQETPSPRFAGFPVFIYHTLQRKGPVLARSVDVVREQTQAVG
jgi:ubiquinone/menaquinone biosynthesis C-methylase UbiE